MSIQALQFISDFSGIAVLGLFIFAMFPIIRVVAKWIETRINGGVPYDVSKGVRELKENHIHEIVSALARIEEKLDKMNDCLVYIKAKIKDNN